MLKVNNLWKTYYNKEGELPTLQGINLTVEKGEFISLIGPSGCGKSTLFNLISGLECPDRGVITLSGRDITGEKGHVSYMLQKDLLLPWRTVLDNCILGLELQGVSRQSARQQAESLLAELNLKQFAQCFPARLSGGMRQRVAFLRTMLAGREILLLDEPFGALDAYTKSGMHGWLNGVVEHYHPTVLFITHDVEEALLLSDRIYVLSRRPASVKLIVKVSLPRPRSREILVDQEFVGLKKTLLDALFEE